MTLICVGAGVVLALVIVAVLIGYAVLDARSEETL